MADTLPADTTPQAVANLAPAPASDMVRLDADLALFRLKREAAEAEREARIRDGIRAEIAHLKCDADPNAATRPFPYLRKGVSPRRGGQS